MENKIYFSNFHISNSGFTCTVKSSLREMQPDDLYFTLEPSGTKPDMDAIACTLSTIAGKRYAEIHADIPVSEECKRQLEVFTSAKWFCPLPKKDSLLTNLAQKLSPAVRWITRVVTGTKTPRIMLNFSGGFDSLAAYAIMPKDHTDLVAVDFGGWFQRETDFFVDFKPNILHTNFRKLKYDRESWTFMGTGSLLFAKQLGADYIAFGNIMESSIGTLKEGPLKVQDPPFSLVGLTSTEFIRGLTEVGTAMIVTHYFPDQVAKSLASLAADGSEKRYRKQILTELVCRRFDRKLTLPDCKIPGDTVALPFGKHFTSDFLALYELKHAGLEVISHTVSDIPPEAVRLSQDLSLDFYEKLNPRFLDTIPQCFQEEYLQKLKEAGVEVYNEKDWEEYRQVRDYMLSLGY